MLLQAAIEIANAERWALEIGDAPAPPSLQQTLRRSAYEVTVVDVLHRVARRYFDQHGYRAVWERAFLTGQRGRPESVDISLFESATGSETRIELGPLHKDEAQRRREEARPTHQRDARRVRHCPQPRHALGHQRGAADEEHLSQRNDRVQEGRFLDSTKRSHLRGCSADRVIH